MTIMMSKKIKHLKALRNSFAKIKMKRNQVLKMRRIRIRNKIMRILI